MAILTAKQQLDLRNGFERTAAGGAIAYSKIEVAGAFQAIEDWMELNKASLGVAIDAGTGFSFTNEQKTFLFAYYSGHRFRKDK